MISIAALTYALLMLSVIAFQFCLTIGLPWGEASMGGKYKGKYPPKMRVVSFINILVLSFLMITVLIRAGVFYPEYQAKTLVTMWFVAGFTWLSTVMNWITPSRIERKIWGPVTTIQLICVMIIIFS